MENTGSASREEHHQLTLLKEIAEALNEANDIASAMDAILPKLSEALGLSTAWAFRYDAARRSFVEVGASGLPPALCSNDSAALKNGWCECQDQFVEGKLNTAVNIVRCSRLRDAEGDKQGLRFHASIPLRSKGKPLGILNVASSMHTVFTEQALQFLNTLAPQVAVAIDRAGLLAEERRRAAQLGALSEMAAHLVSIVNPARLLQEAADQFVGCLGYEACGITMKTVNEDGGPAVTLVAASHQAIGPSSSSYTYSPEQDAPALEEQDRILLPDARSVLVHDIPQTEYQLRVESTVPHAFGALDADLLSTFAWHLTAALENGRLYEQSMQSAKWAERRRLAAALHDSVSQRLFSAILLARTASLMASNPENHDEMRETLQKMQTAITESQEEMRHLIRTLRPSDERGVLARIRERIASLQLQGQTRIHFSADSEVDGRLSLEQREALVQVIDEALHNVLKHARAKHAYVTIALQENRVYTTVRDDGIGFHEQTMSPGVGTSTMYERIHKIGGVLRLHSCQGEGTTLLCEVPIAAPASMEGGPHSG